MEMRVLGKSGLRVSELVFGTLPMGPLQAKLPHADGVRLLQEALDRGINLLDTAQTYQTYEMVRDAIKGRANDVLIASKAMMPAYADMEESVIRAMREIGRDYLDIFFLHAARDVERSTLEKWSGALRCLNDYKKKGYIRAVGLATHSVLVADEAAGHDDIDILFPLINKGGMGILGGTRDEMAAAIKKNADAGKGIYAMKALAGGSYIRDILESLEYVRKLPGVSATAVGMVKQSELEFNLRVFNNEQIDPEELSGLDKEKKLIVLRHSCKGCGSCVEHCPSGALSLSEADGKLDIDHSRCVLCAYCTPHCPMFVLRMA